jgi:glyoxylase-like metal-dependent hydrolase (beta-lactamase superfamily II)
LREPVATGVLPRAGTARAPPYSAENCHALPPRCRPTSGEYGDGSIVIVPAPGHTPGSVIVFVTLPGDVRCAFVGDLEWQREGVLEREEWPGFEGLKIDNDPAALHQSLLRMNAIATRYPQMRIVPAHDARAFGEIAPSPASDALATASR